MRSHYYVSVRPVITKREILSSIVIIFFMIALGGIVSTLMKQNQLERNKIYETATRIDYDQDLFEYAMLTNAGKSFVYGELIAVDPVGYFDIGYDFMYASYIREEYTRHTRTVTETDSEGRKTTRTEVYYDWERTGSGNARSKQLEFLGHFFDSSCLRNLPSNSSFVKTVYHGVDLRYKYSGVQSSAIGTIFSDLRDNQISSNSSFYKNYDILETIDFLESDFSLKIFYVVWIILTVILIVVYYRYENRWLY